MAEYQGLLLGLRRAHELGAEELEVVRRQRADDSPALRGLPGEAPRRCGGSTSEALSILKAFRKVKLVHVPREQNAEADEMSNRAIDEKM